MGPASRQRGGACTKRGSLDLQPGRQQHPDRPAVVGLCSHLLAGLQLTAHGLNRYALVRATMGSVLGGGAQRPNRDTMRLSRYPLPHAPARKPAKMRPAAGARTRLDTDTMPPTAGRIG